MKQNFYDLASAIAEDYKLCFPGSKTLKVLGGMLVNKINETSNLFKDILIDTKRTISDLSEEEKNVFNEECYLIFQYAIQGKAKYNLRVLITFLKNQINEENLKIDLFYEYMDVLSRLTASDITLIKLLYDNQYINENNGNTIDFSKIANITPEKIKLYNANLSSLLSKGFLTAIPGWETLLYKKSYYFENFIK